MTAPERIITLVHGTFSPRAAWTFSDSTFCRILAEHLGAESATAFRRIEWRGLCGTFANNGHDYRLAGGEALAASLKQSFDEFAHAEQWVIAHSHGGMVALYALRDPRVAARLSGIITIATPFIVCEPRDLTSPTIKLCTFWVAPVVAVLALVGAAFVTRYFFSPRSGAADLFMLGNAGAIGIGVAAYLNWGRDAILRRLPFWQRRTLDKLRIPEPRRQRVRCMSIRHDEARGWLDIWYAIAAWPHWLWNGMLYVPFMLAVFMLALVFGDSFLASMSGRVGVARITGALQAALSWALLAGTAHLALMTLVPACTRAIGLGFGQESILDNLLVDIRSALTPGPFSTVTEQHFPSATGGWLRHSRLYESDESISAIARFIQPEPDAPASLPQ